MQRDPRSLNVRPFNDATLHIAATEHGIEARFRCGDMRTFTIDAAERIAERLLAAVATVRAKQERADLSGSE